MDHLENFFGILMFKAVIFDIDGVLVDSFEANLKFFQDLMIKFDYPPPTRENYSALFSLPMYEHIKILTGLTSEEEIKKIWDAAKGGIVSFHDDLVKLSPGVEETLAILSKEYPLAVVTSRIRGAVFRAPQMARLQSYFKTVIAYEDTLNHKPDPEPLLLAAKRLQVRPEEAVYIGDADVDLAAGQASGMKVIIYKSNFQNLPQVIRSSKTLCL